MPRTLARSGSSVAIALVCFLTAQGVALAAAGDLDPTFDRNGKRVIVARDAYARTVLVQPNGKILVAGDRVHDQKGILVRLHPNGALDQGFGDLGFVDQPLAEFHFAFLEDAVLQDNGDILVVGTSQGGFGTVRLLPDGSPDPTFSGDGFAQTTFGAHLTGRHGGDWAHAVAMDGSNIVVAGDADYWHWAVTRYLPDGTRDPSFGNGGKVITQITGFVTDALVQPDGKIVVVGYHLGQVTVARYLSDGTLDPSFGTNGIAIIESGQSRNDVPGQLALSQGGAIVIAGSFSDRFGVLQLTPDGTPDAAFGVDGRSIPHFGRRHTGHAFGVVVQADGDIVAAGCRLTSQRAESALARFLPDGSLDPTFGTKGKVTTAWEKHSGGSGCPTDVALQPDGRLVTAGGEAPRVGDRIAIARYLAA